MLELLKETSNRLTLLHNDCTFEKSEVQFVVLKFVKPYAIALRLDNSTSPTVANFIDCAVTTLWNIELGEVVPSSLDAQFKHGLYELEYFVAKKPTKVITNITEGNLVNGVNILDDFISTNYIILNNSPNIVYEIDKRNSTQHSLFLKKPVSDINQISNYNPVFKSKEVLFVAEHLKKKVLSQIEQLSACTACGNELNAVIYDIIKYMAIERAISCDNIEGAISIFNYLNAKYEKC
jgi:hypothetical protein